MVCVDHDATPAAGPPDTRVARKMSWSEQVTKDDAGTPAGPLADAECG